MKKYLKNDIVKGWHDRLMVVVGYRTMADKEQKVTVSEGGYYFESELKLIFRLGMVK